MSNNKSMFIINDIVELEKYFGKYGMIIYDENYIDSEKVLYFNPYNSEFKNNLYLIIAGDHFNVIDSIKEFCGKYFFYEACLDLFSYRCDHYPCPIKNTVTTTAIHTKV